MEQEKGFTVLLVEKSPEVAKMLAFSLEVDWGAVVCEAHDCQSALDFVNHLEGLGLVVLGHPEEMGELTRALTADESEEGILFVLGVDHKISDPSLLPHPRCLGVVSRSQYLPELRKIIQEKLFPGELQETLRLSDFVRVKVPLLSFCSPLYGDVYIRLSEEKFVKLFRQNEAIEAGDIQKYSERNVEYFYVKRTDCSQFLKAFQLQIENVVREGAVEEVALRALSKDIHETVHWMVNEIGVTEEVREMTRANVQLIIKTVGKTPKLSSVFDRLNKEMGQFIVNHSLTLAEVSCVLASNVEWLSDFTFQKLILASLFHDITVKSHELAKVRTLAEVQRDPDLLLLESFEDYNSHPLKAAELVREIRNIPPDIDAIIRQHHEVADGSGFPGGLTHQQITPLSAVFIVAHDFVDYMMANPNSSGFSEFFDRNRQNYSSGYFKRIVKSLEDKLKREQEQ